MNESPKDIPRLKKDFLLLWLGGTVDLVGDNIFYVAVMWSVLDKTGSAIAMSIVALLDAVPVIIFGSLAGVIADRYSKKKILILINAFHAICTCVLAYFVISGNYTMGHIYVVILLNSIVGTVKYPTVKSIIPQIDRNNIVKMNSLMELTKTLSGIVGASLGGLIVAVFGFGVGIVIDALTFLIETVLLFFIRGDYLSNKVAPQTNAIAEWKEGFQYILKDKIRMNQLFVIVTLVFLAGPVALVIPVIVNNILNMSAAAYGVADSLKNVGLVIGTVILSRYSKFSTTQRFFGINIAFIGFIYVLIGLNTEYILFLGLLVLMGIITNVTQISSMSLLQINCEEEFRGRFFGIIASIFTIGSSLSYVVGGYLIELIGAKYLMMFLGVLIIAVGIVSHYSKLFLSIKINVVENQTTDISSKI